MRVELAILICLAGLIIFGMVSIYNRDHYLIENDCVKTGNSKMAVRSYYNAATKTTMQLLATQYEYHCKKSNTLEWFF